MVKKHAPLPDQHQNFWQLTCIQSASYSIPGLLIGGNLAQQYGPSAAISSICIGNLLLWLIGLGVISIAAKQRKNAIETVRSHIGNTGAVLIAFVVLDAFLTWFMIGIRATTQSFSPLIHSNNNSLLVTGGILLGLLITFLSLGGIRLIRRTCVMSLPVILFFVIYSIFRSNHVIVIETWTCSFSAILTVAALTLPGMVNLPTFFRHSRSHADSILALTLITMFGILFQISSVYSGMTEPSEILTVYNMDIGSILYIAFASAVLVISAICLNLVNIYYASAGLTTILPSLTSSKNYFIVGLLGTAMFAFFHGESTAMQFIADTANNLISNTGIVLIFSFIISVATKNRQRSFEKFINLFCWLVVSGVVLTLQICFPEDPHSALIGGISGSLFAYLSILFIEKTIWSIKKIQPEIFTG